MKWMDNTITGVVSTEGEHLNLPVAIRIFKGDSTDAYATRISVGIEVQNIIEGLHQAMKNAMKYSIEELGKEGRLS